MASTFESVRVRNTVDVGLIATAPKMLLPGPFTIPLATFANSNGLTLVGGNAFAQSGASGTPRINGATTAGSGSIQAYALEGSTVDLATEFTSMITTQQAYSASARVVSTASQMLDELMQMQH